MKRFAEFVLGDGRWCVCPFEAREAPCFDAVCVVSIEGVSEFGRFVRLRTCSGRCDAVSAGTFERVANAEDLTKLSGNETAAARARAVLLKWAAEERRTVAALRMRFTVRRERLYLMMDVVDTTHFQPVFETLEKRFQTQVSVQFLTARSVSGAIGGLGVCGCVLCCATGVSGRTPVELRMARQQGMPLHDSVAAGLCGRLKCCVAYEAESDA